MAISKDKQTDITVDTQGRILLSGRPIGTIRKGNATVDSQYQLLEVSQFLLARYRSVRFQPGLAEQLAAEMQTEPIRHWVRVFQLKPEVEPSLKFISYHDLLTWQGCVKPEQYAVVFDGDVGSNDPEIVYRLLRDHPPEDYKGHTLTRSDVLELYGGQKSQCFYIDTFALQPIIFDKYQYRRIEKTGVENTTP